MPIIAVLGSKGGVGKTTIAAGLLLAAIRAGVDAAGVDLDAWQRSLAEWSAERDGQGLDPAVRVAVAEPAEWRTALPASGVVVVDTPPARDPDTRAALGALVAAADLAVVPVRPALVDLRALVPSPSGAVWVLNGVGRPSARLDQVRAWLAGSAELCPVEVPQRSRIEQEMGTGEGPDLAELWAWASRRLGL